MSWAGSDAFLTAGYLNRKFCSVIMYVLVTRWRTKIAILYKKRAIQIVYYLDNTEEIGILSCCMLENKRIAITL